MNCLDKKKPKDIKNSRLIKAQIALAISAIFGLLALIGIVFISIQSIVFPFVISLTLLTGLFTIVAIILLIHSSPHKITVNSNSLTEVG